MTVVGIEEEGQAAPRDAWPVRTYLILIVATAVAALVAATAYGFVWSTRTSVAAATAAMDRLADRAATAVLDSLAEAVDVTAAVAAQPGLEAVLTSPEGCTLTVQGDATFPSARLDIVAPDGTVVCTSDANDAVMAPAVHADSAWLTAALEGSPTTAHHAADDAATGRPAVITASAIGPPGAVAGLVVSVQHADAAAAAMADGLGVAEQVSLALVDVGAEQVRSASGGPWAAGASLADALDLRGDLETADGRHLVAAAQVGDGDLAVLTAVPRSAVLSTARAALWRQVAVGLIALVFLIAWAVILNRRIAGPLRAVTSAVERAAGDPATERVHPAGTRELRTLAREVNDLLDIRAGHEAQMRHQATHDPLTGLPNVLLLRERVAAALRGYGVGSGVAVLAVGIDRFKLVNDSRGHHAGDRILGDVAGRLSAVLRPDDTLARFSGDVFLMLCHDIRTPEAVEIARRLRSCFDRPFDVPGTQMNVRASIGIASTDAGTTTADQLLREVNTALHHAKRTAVPWSVFDPSLQARATRDLEVERDLVTALARDELFLQYQPLVDLATDRIVGAEALVRWQHPEWGLVPPLDFIPIAEDTGQIVDIGRVVLARACAQAAEWTAAGHPLRVSVNVSAGQLRHDDLPALVAGVLGETGLAAEQLCLEITESALMTASEAGARDLGRIRRSGVRIAIDDFGTGYSSLAYLHDLPIDELKIDRSFVNGIGAGTGDGHLLSAIVAMARALGLTVVAEGVERADQLEVVRALHCDLVQGFLLARPTTPADLLARLAAGSPLLPV